MVRHWALRKLKLWKHRILGSYSWGAYQRSDFNEPRLLRLPKHRKVLDSLTWDIWFSLINNHLLMFRASLVAQLVKNPPTMQETPVLDSWVGKIRWRSERLSTPVFWPGEFYSPWGQKTSLSYFLDVQTTCPLLQNFYITWLLPHSPPGSRSLRVTWNTVSLA